MCNFRFVKHQVIRLLTLTSVLIIAFTVGSFFHPQKVSADMCGTFNCQYGVSVWYDTVAKVRKCQCKSKPADAPVIPQQQQPQQPRPAGCSNRSCPGNECNDGTKYGADPCTPQATCELRDKEACSGHGGPKGSSAQASSQPVGGSCPGTSSNGCSGRNPGDVFHIAGTCLKCVKIGNTCGRNEVACPADLSTVPAVTTGGSGFGQLPDAVPFDGTSSCNANSWGACVGLPKGAMLVSDSPSGVCQQCVMAGNGACARTYVVCAGAKQAAASGLCAAGSADGCYGKKPGDKITVGSDTLTCTRAAASGPCSRVMGTPTQTQQPQKSSPPAASQAVPIPTTVSENKIDYCFKHGMVYVGGCVDKCLPQTKTAIEWTTAICGYTEQQQQDIANKLKTKDRDKELEVIAKKKAQVEQAVSTQNTLDTYDTGPQAGRNCRNRGGTLISCDADGMLCVGDTEVNRTVECQKLHERIEKAKGTGKNWLDNLMTTGGDGQECKKDSDCVSNLCRGYQPGPGIRTCVSYSQAKSDYEASVKLTCTPPSTRDTCKIRGIDEPICLSSGQDKNKACDDLAKRIQAAEDKGMNSFDWQKVLLKVGDKCSDAALCSTGICDVGVGGGDKVCLTQAQLDQKNKTKPAPTGMDLKEGQECIDSKQCRSNKCDKSNAVWLTPTGGQIGKCSAVVEVSALLGNAKDVPLGGACIKDENCANSSAGVMCVDGSGNRVQAGVIGKCTAPPACDKAKGQYDDQDHCGSAMVEKGDKNFVCLGPTTGKPCWTLESQGPAPVACDEKKFEYVSSQVCEIARSRAPAVPSQDTTTKCESFFKDTKTQCWKINTVAVPLPDLCKQTGWRCPWFSFCETVSRTQIRCSSMFGHGNSLTVLNFGDKCKNPGKDSCSCASRTISENDTCKPVGTECPAPKVVFGDKCYDPAALPVPKVNGDCFKAQDVPGAPACPEGSVCLKKAGASNGTCTPTAAGPESFTTGDECTVVGQACMGAKISICQHSKPGDNSSQLKCVEVPMANEDAECNPANDKPCTGRETICALRADNKYRCVDQKSTVYSPGDQCFNPGGICSNNEKIICKVSPTNPQIYTCQNKTQAELCKDAGEYASWNDCHESNRDAVDNQGAECIVRDDQCYILQKQGELKPILKEKLCNFAHCPFGTWCEVVDPEKQTTRCAWAFGGHGDAIPILQPGQRCTAKECSCTILQSNIESPWVCQGSSDGDPCYTPGMKCGKDWKSTCVKGFCRNDK